MLNGRVVLNWDKRARLSEERYLLYMTRCLAGGNLQLSIVSGDAELRTESIAGIVSHQENLSLVCEVGIEIPTTESGAKPSLGCGSDGLVSSQLGGQTAGIYCLLTLRSRSQTASSHTSLITLGMSVPPSYVKIPAIMG